jgi:hypothetical protein
MKTFTAIQLVCTEGWICLKRSSEAVYSVQIKHRILHYKFLHCQLSEVCSLYTTVKKVAVLQSSYDWLLAVFVLKISDQWSSD